MPKAQWSAFFGGMVVGILVACLAFAWLSHATHSSPEHSPHRMVLKLAHGLDTSHPVHLGMEYMKERLESISEGRVSLDIYPGGVLGSETQCLEQLQNGALAMTKTSASPMEGFIPEMGVFNLPYVFRDRDHYWKILDGSLGRELLQKGQNRFLRGLCYYDAGSRNFYTADKPILRPEDLKGMKIRVMNSRTAMKMVETMGGAPTPIAWGELYTALQQGTVDGAENNPPSYYSNKHYEVCKHFSLDGHTRIPDILLISTKVWDRLDPRVQAWVQQAADESSHYQRRLWQEKTEEALNAMRKEGVTVYEPDVQPFKDSVKPMLEPYTGTAVGQLLERIQQQ